jgi:hypothetical protein
MTKLHFNYKDVFRALRVGFSAKKVWMMFIGTFVGFAGYSVLTYLAYIVSGNDFITVWENYRLLPFPEPGIWPFPWYSWIIFGLGVVWFVVCCLVGGTAVSRVAYEQLRGDEFYESREAYKFAFRNLGAVLTSPLLLLAFVAVIVIGGLILSLLCAIPFFGEMFVGLMALPAFAAGMFIVYLLVVFGFCLLLAPGVVGSTRDDTFDTLFEVFSCVNEQPGRSVWYLATAGVLANFGAFLLAFASGAAARIAYLVVRVFSGLKLDDAVANAGFYFKINLPEWCPRATRDAVIWFFDRLGLPQAYMPTEYVALGWSSDVASVLIAVAIYVIALVVLSYGLSIWYCGTVLSYSALAKKKDDKNILELPDDDEDLIEPVVPKPGYLKTGGVPAFEDKPAATVETAPEGETAEDKELPKGPETER